VRPLSFYSKSFSIAQVTKYSAMEKEFMALMLSVLNFRDYLAAVPITYVLSDSQPILWALKHKDTNVKLSRQRAADPHRPPTLCRSVRALGQPPDAALSPGSSLQFHVGQ
jgi:hypothetical protein